MFYNDVTKAHDFIVDFLKLVHAAEKIVITTHITPDDDAIASILAMYRVVVDMNPGKTQVEMMITGEPVDSYVSFQNFDKIQFVRDLTSKIEKVDLLIMVDGNSGSRFTKHVNKLKQFTGSTICIDHHGSPPDQFDLAIVDPKIPANIEIIYRLFEEYLEIDAPLAEIILLGILGDTGNFTYLRPEQSETLAVGKRMIEIANVDIQTFQARYRTISDRVFQLVGQFMKNTKFVTVGGWPAMQVSYLKREMIEKEKYLELEVSEAKGIYMAHYLRILKGYTWGLVFSPKDDGSVSMSHRSLPGSVSGRDMFERIGVGGGHDRASGGEFKPEHKGRIEVQDCIRGVTKWMKKNKPVLN